MRAVTLNSKPCIPSSKTAESGDRPKVWDYGYLIFLDYSSWCLLNIIYKKFFLTISFWIVSLLK